MRNFLEWHLGRHGGVGIIAAGGIEQNGRRSDRFFGRLMAALEARRIHGIATKKLRVTTSLGDCLYACLASFGVATDYGYLGTGLGHGLGTGAAEGTSGTDHHGDFISEIEHAHKRGRMRDGFPVEKKITVGARGCAR